MLKLLAQSLHNEQQCLLRKKKTRNELRKVPPAFTDTSAARSRGSAWLPREQRYEREIKGGVINICLSHLVARFHLVLMSAGFAHLVVIPVPLSVFLFTRLSFVTLSPFASTWANRLRGGAECHYPIPSREVQGVKESRSEAPIKGAITDD